MNEKINTSLRKKVNNELYELGKVKHFDFPFTAVRNVLKNHGIIILQEDNTQFAGMFLGNEANFKLEIAFINSLKVNHELEEMFFTPISNSLLVFYYYKLESGYWEVNTYLS